ncbi:MAG TPA: transglutaminase-like domain-containing protein, partial [Candidatus Methylomirabilis sp.]|nr:transglutaminase-like domain-containing protein [Candidatus Methylomirabilis sp.]
MSIGLPRVDAFLHAFSHVLHEKGEAASQAMNPQTTQLIEGLRSIETDAGLSDGLALLTSDASFETKLALYQGHLEPIIDWLRDQDLAPFTPSITEATEPPPEGPPPEKTDEQQAEPESSVPPPDTDDFQPSMDEMSEGKEGEPQAHFTVRPFYGGYYRASVYSRWDPDRAAWGKAPAKHESPPDADPAVDRVMQRAMQGSIRGRVSVTIPLPYGWTVLPTTFTTNAPADSVSFVQSGLGDIAVRVEADGVFRYEFRIARSVRPIATEKNRAIDERANADLSTELARMVKETQMAQLSLGGKARAIVKAVRDHLVYSNESAMNAVYRAAPQEYVDAVWKSKKADCDVANTVAALALRTAGIACRLVTGHYVKNKASGDRALMTSGTGHAWLEVWDEGTKRWFRADATPKGDPTLDEERPDEQSQESGEGDFGEKESEIMGDEELQKLIESLEASNGLPEDHKTADERQLEEFAKQAECSREEAKRVRAAIQRVRELKDAKGERIGEQLIREWKKLVHDRMTMAHVYEGPVRMK